MPVFLIAALLIAAVAASGFWLYQQMRRESGAREPSQTAAGEPGPPPQSKEPPAEQGPPPVETPSVPTAQTPEAGPAAPEGNEAQTAPPAAPIPEGPPEPKEEAPPPKPAPASIMIEYAGPSYAVSLYDGRRMLKQFPGGSAALEVPAGSHNFRIANDEVYLNRELGRVNLKPEQVYPITVPGLASAYIEVPNDAYEGCEIVLSGIPLPTPYPAQIQELAAGDHPITFRWSSGKYEGKEFDSTISVEQGHHYLVLGDPGTDRVTVQMAR